MTPSPFPQMPMAKQAAQASGAPTGLPPSMPPPMPPVGGTQMPTAQASPMAATVPPMGGFPAPGAPASPPFTTKIQADGSIAVVLRTADGQDVISQVFPTPKIPKAFTTQPSQGGMPQQPMQ